MLISSKIHQIPKQNINVNIVLIKWGKSYIQKKMNLKVISKKKWIISTIEQLKSG